jgi:negative regulator of flagellin synthesis FlgM
MKIQGNKPPESQGVKLDIQKVSRPDSKNALAQAGKAGPADKIDISAEGKEVAEIMSAMDQMPDIRTDKVNAVKKAIESGNYNIDPLKIAGKILSEL